MPPCKTTSFGARVCLVAMNKPLIGDGNPKRLPILAVKVSTGKAVEKGIEHYLTAPWKEGWDEWIKQAKEAFPSVLEHIVLTFHIDGCSRVCSHQLVRHRLVSFTQESQRYTEARILKALKANNTEEALFLTEDLLLAFEKGWMERVSKKDSVKVQLPTREIKASEVNWDEMPTVDDALSVCDELMVAPPKLDKKFFCKNALRSVASYLLCRLNGYAMEDCRFLLPQAVRTSLLATANLREWFHVIELRAHPKAQWEIREVAEKIKEFLALTNILEL